MTKGEQRHLVGVPVRRALRSLSGPGSNPSTGLSANADRGVAFTPVPAAWQGLLPSCVQLALEAEGLQCTTLE